MIKSTRSSALADIKSPPDHTDKQEKTRSAFGRTMKPNWSRNHSTRSRLALAQNNLAMPTEIMNTDQGAQFTGFEWINALKDAEVKISMDGRGRWIDNPMVERLWRSVKYESVYLHAFETGSQAKRQIGQWMEYYNTERPHSSHCILTPNEAYVTKPLPKKLAA